LIEVLALTGADVFNNPAPFGGRTLDLALLQPNPHDKGASARFEIDHNNLMSFLNLFICSLTQTMSISIIKSAVTKEITAL
jgi:hypothetical protein